MKHGSTLFLKITLLVISLAVLAGMLYFPHTEGRAANLDFVSVYADPLIIYIYISSIAFFFGMYQAYRLLNLIDANKAFSRKAVNALKNIKYASVTLVGLIAFALLYIRFYVKGDDPAGPTMLGLCVSVALITIATSAGVFEKLFQSVVDMKSENDLTV